MNERVLAEDEESFGISRGNLGAGLPIKDKTNMKPELNSPPSDVCAENRWTPVSFLVRCENLRILILCVFKVRSCPNTMTEYDDEVVEAIG